MDVGFAERSVKLAASKIQGPDGQAFTIAACRIRVKSGSVNVASVIRAQDRMTITAYYCVTVWQQLLVVQEGIMCTYR